MKLYDETKPLCLESDTSGVGLGAGLLQTRSSASCPRDKDQTTVYPGLLHLQARAYWAQIKDTAT